ncbi:hypothetical protein VitviT2T_004022 [Vitis vinifera]|uniref:Integrase catalytic domain-containing protein n=1 Tax=Vitis vinifera TaxID=29760 RepID=A0ABY9BNA2_VITVI|nr:hypothetical protein VitviT2T_004022 [Vitis vinifera]
MVQTQFSTKIKILRSDNGGEYVNQQIQTYFNSHGILHETSCSQTPQQNGTAERKNRHILETARALLLNAHVPNRYWSDVVATAVHLLNSMPTKVLQFQTPVKVLSDHVSLPNVLMIPPRIFGCVVFVHIHKNQRTKLDPCAVRCLFLGYGVQKKGYRCYDPIAKRTYIAMDVTFLESENFFPSPVSNSPLQGEIHGEERNWLDVEILDVGDNLAHPNDGNNMVEDVGDNLAHPNDGNDMVEPPRTEVEPIPESSEDAESNESLHSLVPNDPPPENIPEVSSFITPLQTNAIDTSAGYVLPFRHNRGKPPTRYSPDIEERRSKYPIANYVSNQRLFEPLRAFAHTLSSCQILSCVEEALSDSNWAQAIKGIGANLDWPFHQLDVKNAFLHGDLEEEIYMDLPPGYTATPEAKIACRLQRALYGLKQSPRAWFGRFSSAMRKYGFQQSNSDHTLFLKHQVGKITALIVYVDDMIITGDDVEEISKLQEQLSTKFEMKNLGGLKYFLGIEVARSRQGIFLSQKKYILDLLAEVGLLGCKPVDIPIVQNHKLGEYVDQILRYLKSSPGKKLMFLKNSHLNVAGYIDADWAGNITDMKSTSGYFTFVGGNLVTWRSKKQKVVALSSAEAEFQGMVKGICELLWLKKLLAEIGVAPNSEMNLFCDNKAAIAIFHNPVQHDRTKHVEVDLNFIKQNLEEKIIQLPFVKSEDQLADILTKAVSARNYYNSLDKLGIGDIYAPT